MTMGKLESDYPGDAQWQSLVALYEQDYLDEHARALARLLGNHLDMAVIIYGKRGREEGCWWIEQSVPALNDLRPVDCLVKPHLIRRLRSALMRMP